LKSTFQIRKQTDDLCEISAVDTETTPAVTPNCVYPTRSNYVDATYGDGPANGPRSAMIDATQLRTQVAAVESARAAAEEW
jgi:hypothetical protein